MADFSLPKSCGAQCDRCPLSGVGDLVPSDAVSGPVPPEDSGRAWMAVVGQSPKDTEVEQRRPLTGASGREATRSFKQAGIRRQEILWVDAIGCRVPRDDPQAFSIRVSRRNRQAEAAHALAVASGLSAWGPMSSKRDPVPGAAPWSQLVGKPIDILTAPILLQPVTACNPWLKSTLRMLAERNQAMRVVPLGSFGLKGIAQLLGAGADDVAKPILNVRGTLWESEARIKRPTGEPVSIPVQILPTVHPSFVLHASRWRRVFDVDTSRAGRWFRGRLGWVDPEMIFQPTPAELRAFLTSSPDGLYFWDIETLKGLGFESYDPLDDRMGCIGIGFSDRVVVVPILNIDGTPAQTPGDEGEIKDILREWFLRPSAIKVGHNSGYYDAIVIEQWLGVTPAPAVDSILVHRAVESELPHSLAFVGSIYTDVKDWKGDHTATAPPDNRTWWDYNAKDVSITARVFPVLAQQATERGMSSCLQYDHKRQAVCRGLHRVGMLVDQTAREEWETKLTAEMKQHTAECRRRLGQDEGEGYSEEEAIELAKTGGMERKALTALRRKVEKLFNPNSVQQVSRVLFGDYGLIPIESTDTGEPSTSDDVLRTYLTDLALPAEQREFIGVLRKARRTQKMLGTYVRRLRPERLRNGRIHADYSAHSMVSQRVSSSNCNMQNFPMKLRNMLIAPPGHVIVGADADQLELRYVAAKANAVKYLQAFAEGKDPHAMTAEMCYGSRFTSLEPKSEDWVKIRNVSKTWCYLSLYGGESEGAHAALTATEDKSGNLIYLDFKLREVVAIRRNWLASNPEFEQWWARELELYRRQGFIRDSILGMRRDFLDGEDAGQIYNFDAQSGGAGIVWLATFDILKQIPFEKWGPHTGLACQVHDAVYMVVPESEGERTAEIITTAMDRRVPGLDVRFTGKAKLMDNWRDERKST